MNFYRSYSHFNMDTLTATYTFSTTTDTDAIIRDTTISGTVSSLIGVAPEDVVITSSSGEVDYTYDKDSQVFIATKVRKEVDGKKQNAYDYVSNSLYYNTWTIKVKYPSLEKALYDTNINVSIDSYAYATNNPDVGYEDKRSNVVNQILNYNIYINSEGNLIDFSDIEVGTYSYKNGQYHIDSSKLMNHFLGVKEDNFTYPVKWKVTYQYTTTNIGKVIVKDKNDFFKVADNTKEYITYKNINIINTKELKGTIIKVINNDTDEVLYVYNENNFGEVYEFPKGVSSIRLESDTHEINVRYDYEVRITKEIDNEKMVNAVSLAKFNTYTQLTSGFEMVDGRPENTGINRITHQENANLTPRISKTYITLDKNSYEPKNMADTTIPMNIKINHCSDNDEPSLCNVWKKETHLLIFSENITDVELPTLNSYSGYSLEKTMIGDKIGVKVTYNNETSSNLTTNLNLKVTINPKSLSGKNYIEVYSADEVAYKYQNPKSDIYDINGNGNVIDQVNYTSASFDLIVPKELVTGAQIKNYDSKDSVTISPLIADVEIMDGKQEADMEIFMINNSTNAVDGIVTIGRIGYVGNTYQMSSGELGTEYNTNIKSAIQVPDEIKDKTKVYYSDKENPTKDLEDTENNWVENPNDFSTIKNYMIVVDPDYSLESGKELAFTYKISIPNKRANLMKVSYFNHGVYFNYLTDNGRYATSA